MQLRMKEPYRKGGANRLAARTLWRGCSPTVSAPVKKSITSAGLVSGSPIGGDAVVLIAGPCAVEHEQQLGESARAASQAGARMLRGGAFKPRTSPYSFQGVGDAGLRLLRAAADLYDLAAFLDQLGQPWEGQTGELERRGHDCRAS